MRAFSYRMAFFRKRALKPEADTVRGRVYRAIAWCVRFALLLVAAGLLLLLAANLWLVLGAESIARTPAQLRPVPVALVLGASHWSADGRPSRHFSGRMDAAAQLYHAGAVRHILASGANPGVYYNEPQRMFEALTARGVPPSAITLDFAGRRTLDSVVRARRIFGVQSVVLVSQRYHLYRALYLARAHGFDAQAYAAAGPEFSARWKTELREVMARLLAVLDVHVLHTQPQVLGAPEPIVLASGIVTAQ